MSLSPPPLLRVTTHVIELALAISFFMMFMMVAGITFCCVAHSACDESCIKVALAIGFDPSMGRQITLLLNVGGARMAQNRKPDLARAKARIRARMLRRVVLVRRRARPPRT